MSHQPIRMTLAAAMNISNARSAVKDAVGQIGYLGIVNVIIQDMSQHNDQDKYNDQIRKLREAITVSETARQNHDALIRRAEQIMNEVL